VQLPLLPLYTKTALPFPILVSLNRLSIIQALLLSLTFNNDRYRQH